MSNGLYPPCCCPLTQCKTFDYAYFYRQDTSPINENGLINFNHDPNPTSSTIIPDSGGRHFTITNTDIYMINFGIITGTTVSPGTTLALIVNNIVVPGREYTIETPNENESFSTILKLKSGDVISLRYLPGTQTLALTNTDAYLTILGLGR